jgi:hypothetical protein
MIRTFALLLALVLAFAPAPARAQDSARTMEGATPLPAVLQPDAPAPRAAGIAERRPDPIRAAAIGMGVGCVIFGALGATQEAETSDIRVTNTLMGCAFGTFVGGVFGFTFAGLKGILQPR